MKKIEIFKSSIMLLAALSLFLVSCGNNNISNQHYSKPDPPTIMYYKRIPVKITEIRKTWCSNKEQVWCITVKSDKYKLEESFRQSMSFMHSDIYAGKLYYGEIKQGSIIHAELLSWKKGDKVIRRELGSLIE